MDKQAKTDKNSVSCREETGKATDEKIAYRTIPFDKTRTVPETLLSRLKYEYLRREIWVPLEINEGRISILIDDPQNILKRDAIESLLKTKAVDYCLAP
ncbi:MAG: hypothetical protein NTZ24_01995, partial [Deltaproteobacteria bacterium]|nr:hypothetical protein [Deltaproteobacteria bacterium]